MNFEMPQFILALPEIFLLGMICLILVVDLFVKQESRVVTYLLSQATLWTAIIFSIGLYSTTKVTTFNGEFVLDPMASLLKPAILLLVSGVFLYARNYLAERDLYKGEFYVLGLSATLGMLVMTSAHSFLTLYLGLELLSLSLYALVAMQRDSVEATEAAMKYFVLGAMASAMLLYGMSIIYGVTGSLKLDEVSAAIATGELNRLALTFGLVFILVGVAFKLGAVPFHMWVPDIYHGAPTAVTALISTAPKLAAFAMMMRLLVDGMSSISPDWQQILVLLAVLSIILGNVIAIAQTNIKRMLAYSGISHIGFLLMGILTATSEGYAASMYYAIVYGLMALAGFGMIILMSRQGFEAENLDDYKGLHKKSPWFALMILFVMFSMAGVPPFLGFWAKLAVIQAALSVDMVMLALTAVLFSVVGAFYYLRIIKLVYFDDSENDSIVPRPTREVQIIFSVNALLILFLGLMPDSLMQIVKMSVLG